DERQHCYRNEPGLGGCAEGEGIARSGRLRHANLRRVTPGDQIDDDGIAASVSFVISFQLGAQAPRFYPNNRIDTRIVRVLTVENLDADEIFLQVVGLAVE